MPKPRRKKPLHGAEPAPSGPQATPNSVLPIQLHVGDRYRHLKVNVVIEDPVARVSRVSTHLVQLRKYFMMDWTNGTEEKLDYNAVTRGSKDDAWFQANKQRIRTAAMGKGAPQDYELALEWAVRHLVVRGPDASR